MAFLLDGKTISESYIRELSMRSSDIVLSLGYTDLNDDQRKQVEQNMRKINYFSVDIIARLKKVESLITWIPAQNGYVKSIPTLDLEGLIDIRTKQYKNVRFTGLEKQMDYLLTVSFFGDDMKELLHKAIYIKNFYIKSIDWSETIIDTWSTT